MRRIIPMSLVLALLVLDVVLGLAGRSIPVSAQQDCQRFDQQIGHTLCGRFLQYWQQHGALAQQGYPISEPFAEMSDTDGKIYTVQYFERAVFELHPENPAPYDVLLSLLGNLAYKGRYPDGAPGQVPNALPGAEVFSQTGKSIGGGFLSYWEAHGGLAQQGYPITDEFIETSATDGKIYRVQYFERAVFELHPENPAPYDVLLSLLGASQLREKYGDGSSLPSAPAPVFASGGLGLSRTAWEQLHGPGGDGVFDTPPDRDGYGVVYISVGSKILVAAAAKRFQPYVSIDQARAESKSLLPQDAQPVALNEIDGFGAGVSETYDTYWSASLGSLIPQGTPRIFGEGTGPDIWNNAQPGTITIKYDPYEHGTDVVNMFIYVGGRNK